MTKKAAQEVYRKSGTHAQISHSTNQSIIILCIMFVSHFNRSFSVIFFKSKVIIGNELYGDSLYKKVFMLGNMINKSV